MSASTRGLTPVLPLGLHGDACRNRAGAIVLWLPGLRLEAEAVGQRPAPRLCRLQQNRFLGLAAGWILNGRIDLIEERERVEIALRVGERRLVERIAGMHGDGPRHRLRAREMQSRQQHVAHKNLLSLVDMEDHVDLAGVGGFGLLGDVHGSLVKAPAVIRGHQRVVVAGQVARRKHLARRGVQQRQQRCRRDVLVAFDPQSRPRATAALP